MKLRRIYYSRSHNLKVVGSSAGAARHCLVKQRQANGTKRLTVNPTTENKNVKLGLVRLERR
ncbi:MAG: hypothetical protein JKY84_00950 [Emcibacteraceae bacterium]|nr:hypothetical protein [Emcibacteraceae bacterium]